MSQTGLDPVFAALADPTRRAIVARLAAGDATVSEIARPFALTQPSISKHLKVLERAGLISRSRSAQTRPCRLRGEPLGEIAQWVGMYREQWAARLDRLEAALGASGAGEAAKAADRDHG